MNKNLKKSLFVGMAALGFVTAASSINANNASAKSYAKVTSNKWIGTSTDNNVVLNGSNALYTKAGTLKGAKKVASTTTLKKLAKSKSSEDNFVAYRVATTNRGSVYYKVVSLDKSYRGWIYGGKSTTTMAGGVTPFTTFKQDAAVSSDNQGNFKFKTVGTTNDGTMLTYKDPMYTIYGSGRQITDSTQYKDDILTITKQGTRTREGDQWVYVEDANNSTVNGWILKSGLKATNDIPASQGVTIKYINKANPSEELGTYIIQFNKTTTVNNTDVMDVTTKGSDVRTNAPKGTTFNSWADQSAATKAAKGSTVLVYVTKNASVNMTGQGFYTSVKGSKTAINNAVNASNQSVNAADVKLNAVDGTLVNYSDITTAVTTAKLNTVYAANADGKTYSKYTFDENYTKEINGSDLAITNNGHFNLGYKLEASDVTLGGASFSK